MSICNVLHLDLSKMSFIMNLSQICDRERRMDKGTPMKIKVKLAASVSQLTDCCGSFPLKLEEKRL